MLGLPIELNPMERSNGIYNGHNVRQILFSLYTEFYLTYSIKLSQEDLV
jgi:hypothetical protein